MALSQFTVWWALWRKQNSNQGLTIKIFLANNFQRRPSSCLKMWPMLENGGNFSKKWDASAKHYGSWSFWLLGYWFHWPFSFISREWVYSSGCYALHRVLVIQVCFFFDSWVWVQRPTTPVILRGQVCGWGDQRYSDMKMCLHFLRRNLLPRRIWLIRLRYHLANVEAFCNNKRVLLGWWWSGFLLFTVQR